MIDEKLLKMRFTHYAVDIDMIKPVQAIMNRNCDPIINKPTNAYWASPMGEDYCTWEEWSNSNNMDIVDAYNYMYIFRLSKDAKILVIDDPAIFKDNENLLVENKDSIINFCCNWPYIFDNYDGMLLIHGEHYSEFHYSEFHAGLFYSWDCDSLVIWNASIVEDNIPLG